MKGSYYLAVDIGASSGRHILGWIEDGRLCLEEVYRFPNGMSPKNGHMCWDHEALTAHILEGLRRCAEVGKKPSYMAIDTWGVDFLLLDGDGQVIGDAVGYRDDRTEGIDQAVYEKLSEEELYARTGIQKQPYNTIYQLMALQKQAPEQLAQAEHLLMMPDYLSYRLTGVCHQEYTNATTAQLVSLTTGQWDKELIERLGYPTRLFEPLHMPGETVGRLLPEHAAAIGYDLTVLHPASHDTASAVLAVPTNSDQVAFLSSGTWSLMGMERMEPDSSAKAHDCNFTNEGGFAHRYRFLKNIMGLWIIQSIRRELDGKYSFAELCDMAEAVEDTPYRINVNSNDFLAPSSMIDAIRGACQAPEMSLGELLCCVYRSLAECYGETIRELETVTGKKPEALHIIGGGSKDPYLNRLTAEALDIPVYAGPTEATAIGNLLSQMLGTGVFGSVAEARETVFRSFDVQKILK
ncbi:MAG: rhamnulokinase [Ruminococcaceae bacterium]|nr:rhamnulokinase [Oscillospiraceae bacterium]